MGWKKNKGFQPLVLLGCKGGDGTRSTLGIVCGDVMGMGAARVRHPPIGHLLGPSATDIIDGIMGAPRRGCIMRNVSNLPPSNTHTHTHTYIHPYLLTHACVYTICAGGGRGDARLRSQPSRDPRQGWEGGRSTGLGRLALAGRLAKQSLYYVHTNKRE